MTAVFSGIFILLIGAFVVTPRPGVFTWAFVLFVVVLPLLAAFWLRLNRFRDRRPIALRNGVCCTQERDALIAAREEERLRIRRELHDSLGPALAGIGLRLDVAAERVTAQSSTRRLILDAAAETSRTLEDIRRIIEDLGPVDLEGVGLPEALRRLAGRMDAETGLELRTELPDMPPVSGFCGAGELAAYRIASEGLMNVLRHARARTATVRLVDRGEWLVLEVIDDGIGPARSEAGGQGIGLLSMARRAEDVGGCCYMLPRPDAETGTLVRAVLPRAAI